MQAQPLTRNALVSYFGGGVMLTTLVHDLGTAGRHCGGRLCLRLRPDGAPVSRPGSSTSRRYRWALPRPRLRRA